MSLTETLQMAKGQTQMLRQRSDEYKHLQSVPYNLQTHCVKNLETSNIAI